MTYNIGRNEINLVTGLCTKSTLMASGIQTEKTAHERLDSMREAAIMVEANGRYTTEVSNWCFNILASQAAGDKTEINYFIFTKKD